MGISLIPAYYAKADDQVSVSISSASGTVGSEVTVTVTISADKDIDGATINVSYDKSIIRPVDKANSGVVMFSALEMTSDSTVSISQNLKLSLQEQQHLALQEMQRYLLMENLQQSAVLHQESHCKSSSQLFLRQHIKVPADKSGNAFTSIFTRQDNIQCNC